MGEQQLFFAARENPLAMIVGMFVIAILSIALSLYLQRRNPKQGGGPRD